MILEKKLKTNKISKQQIIISNDSSSNITDSELLNIKMHMETIKKYPIKRELAPSIKLHPLIKTRKQNMVKIILKKLFFKRLSINSILVSSTNVLE
tara:strand:+ start:1361 stop:1648 length:288 start_codon:yes stop_codon:yes gene_type:complete